MQAPNTNNVDQAIIDFTKKQAEQAKKETEQKKAREKQSTSGNYYSKPNS